MVDVAAVLKKPPAVNMCLTCGNCGLGDGVWYCASKVSRDVDPEECLPLEKMYAYKLCGPAVQWMRWEHK